MFEKVKILLELLALLAILYAFFWHPSIRRCFVNKGTRVAVVLILFLFLAETAAQLLNRRQYQYPQRDDLYPFARWAMYPGFIHNVDRVTTFDWQGIRQDGTSVTLNPARLFKTTNASTHYTKTTYLGSRLLSDRSKPDDWLASALDSLCGGLARRYNNLYPENPILEIRLWTRSFPMKRRTDVPIAFDPAAGEVIFVFRTTNL